VLIAMFKLALLSLFAATIVTGFLLQNSPGTNSTQTITVRLLNGKNGKPIKDDTPNIWLGGSTRPDNPLTNSHGDVLINVDGPQAQEIIRVLSNWYADCRFEGDRDDGMHLNYSLEEVLLKGVVSDNLCGKRRVQPIPGVLVLYVRPRTFWERFFL
jgi:hypothetical protein